SQTQEQSETLLPAQPLQDDFVNKVDTTGQPRIAGVYPVGQIAFAQVSPMSRFRPANAPKHLPVVQNAETTEDRSKPSASNVALPLLCVGMVEIDAVELMGNPPLEKRLRQLDFFQAPLGRKVDMILRAAAIKEIDANAIRTGIITRSDIPYHLRCAATYVLPD